MGYATQADLEARYGAEEILQLADRNRDGVIDAGVIDRALADADAEINGYLGGRYQLPLADVPQIINVYACDIARFRLYNDLATEEVRKRYEDAIKFMRMAGEGKVRIGPASSGAEPSQAGGAEIESGGRVFGRDQAGFI
jgi:phage gp36-like protein